MWRVSVAIVMCGLSTVALATPQTASWSGRLFDASGQPVDGTHDVVVVFHDSVQADDDSVLGSEAFVDVPFEAGFTTLTLGQSGGLSSAVLASDDVWLELRVDGQRLGALQPIHAAPFAMVAGGLSSSAQRVQLTDSGIAPSVGEGAQSSR